jgi:hypothetical protein
LRISQLVRERGIDSFNLEDFKFVGSKLAIDPNRLILVGGQAIETWGHYFDVLPPTGNNEPLTEDIDWYGSKKDAMWLCSLLGGKANTELIVAKDFDPSPNTALAYLQRPDGRILMMDFLRALIGLKDEDITKFAVPIAVSGIRLNVLHPLLCLESRLANLEKLSSKRTTNGVMQAKWTIDIAEAYLLKMRSIGASDRDMIKACTQIAESAEFRSGPYCYRSFQLDPLLAVSQNVLDAVGGRFVTDDWPRRLDRIKAKREKIISYKFRLEAIQRKRL